MSTTSRDPIAAAKRRAAEGAAALIEDGMLLGIGTGSTVAFFIESLGERVGKGLSVRAAVTSQESERLARAARISLVDVSGSPTLDLDVDGADEIDPELNVLKGGGGALLHEKLVALSSRQFVVIADESKLVTRLGQRPLPVEVVAFYWGATLARIENLGGEAALRMAGGAPFVTDSGNHIFDVAAPKGVPIFEFADGLKSVPGVVDHGIFRGLASRALVGKLDGSVADLVPSEASRGTGRPEQADRGS